MRMCLADCVKAEAQTLHLSEVPVSVTCVQECTAFLEEESLVVGAPSKTSITPNGVGYRLAMQC
jgi:hypothetical protein